LRNSLQLLALNYACTIIVSMFIQVSSVSYYW